MLRAWRVLLARPVFLAAEAGPRTPWVAAGQGQPPVAPVVLQRFALMAEPPRSPDPQLWAPARGGKDHPLAALELKLPQVHSLEVVSFWIGPEFSGLGWRRWSSQLPPDRPRAPTFKKYAVGSLPPPPGFPREGKLRDRIDKNAGTSKAPLFGNDRIPLGCPSRAHLTPGKPPSLPVRSI